MSYISLDVDIDDILSGMTRRELQQLSDDLYEDGYCPSQIDKEVQSENYSEFDKQVQKLIGNSWRLTKEDEETILKITNKLI
jgi:hypothetical protein